VKQARVLVLDLYGGDGIDLVEGSGIARVVVGPALGAALRTICRVTLEPGARTVTLRHPGEAVWYVISGAGSVSSNGVADTSSPLSPGTMVHVGPEGDYRFAAADTGVLEVVGGPSPVDPEFGRRPTGDPSSGAVRLFHRDRPAMLVPMISSDARLIVFPGVGAETANMNYVRLADGEANRPHNHPISEDTIVILSGRGTVDDLTNGCSLEFEAGSVIHVPVGLQHRVKADRDSAVESVGGPCPADRNMLALAQAPGPSS
jgi:quercetin dioxygenase-like cupin family protein